jgi:hypothetical protein
MIPVTFSTKFSHVTTRSPSTCARACAHTSKRTEQTSLNQDIDKEGGSIRIPRKDVKVTIKSSVTFISLSVSLSLSLSLSLSQVSHLRSTCTVELIMNRSVHVYCTDNPFQNISTAQSKHTRLSEAGTQGQPGSKPSDAHCTAKAFTLSLSGPHSPCLKHTHTLVYTQTSKKRAADEGSARTAVAFGM